MKKWMSILKTWMGGGLFLLGGLLLSQAETLPVHPRTRLLKSGKLAVEIDDPAAVEHNRYNRSARRFSPVAMVLRAQFDGKDFFYSPIDGGTYGWVGGAPMEFDLGENGMNKFRLTTPPGYSGPNALTVRQTQVKQSLGIEASLLSNAVDLWCTGRQLSPEMLVLVALHPGQEKRWTRTYTFSSIIP